jgi:predicted alpha-1,6-mannanase (GH76 family)
MADWIDETLIDPDTHLVFDGIKGGSMVRAQYTYCQGVVLGLEVELAARTQDDRHSERVHRLVAAVHDNMAPGGVIAGAGGGDGGLFDGILVRYLALAANLLPGDTSADVEARAAAKELVLKSAQSAWDHRQTVDGLPLFGAFWDRDAELPRAGGKDAQFVDGAVNASEVPERDLSVQLSGWMLMEAAHTVADEGHGVEPIPPSVDATE